MPTKRQSVVGGLALSLGSAWSSRRNPLSVDAAPSVMESISALLQQREMGSQQLHTQLMHYAAVTPGAGDQYGTSLQLLVDKIENELEKQVREGQKATQVELDLFFKDFTDANTRASEAQAQAKIDDEQWFGCVANELTLKQAEEAADKSLSTSRSNENEACQQQQDDRPYSFDSAGKYATSFTCDFGNQNCDAAFEAYKTDVIAKIRADAAANLAAEKANYIKLKEACAAKKQERVEAQSALSSAEQAWAAQRTNCSHQARSRQTSICTFGSRSQIKCWAENEFSDFVATTRKAGGDEHSEVDREAEWTTLQTTKCLLSGLKDKGLSGAIAAADVDTCVTKAKGSYANDVTPPLNTRGAEFSKLQLSNKCGAERKTFFNGQTWHVPKVETLASSDYKRVGFEPNLDPTAGTATNPGAGNFDFCPAIGTWVELYKHYWQQTEDWRERVADHPWAQRAKDFLNMFR